MLDTFLEAHSNILKNALLDRSPHKKQKKQIQYSSMVLKPHLPPTGIHQYKDKTANQSPKHSKRKFLEKHKQQSSNTEEEIKKMIALGNKAKNAPNNSTHRNPEVPLKKIVNPKFEREMRKRKAVFTLKSNKFSNSQSLKRFEPLLQASPRSTEQDTLSNKGDHSLHLSPDSFRNRGSHPHLFSNLKIVNSNVYFSMNPKNQSRGGEQSSSTKVKMSSQVKVEPRDDLAQSPSSNYLRNRLTTTTTTTNNGTNSQNKDTKNSKILPKQKIESISNNRDTNQIRNPSSESKSYQKKQKISKISTSKKFKERSSWKSSEGEYLPASYTSMTTRELSSRKLKKTKSKKKDLRHNLSKKKQRANNSNLNNFHNKHHHHHHHHHHHTNSSFNKNNHSYDESSCDLSIPKKLSSWKAKLKQSLKLYNDKFNHPNIPKPNLQMSKTSNHHPPKFSSQKLFGYQHKSKRNNSKNNQNNSTTQRIIHRKMSQSSRSPSKNKQSKIGAFLKEGLLTGLGGMGVGGGDFKQEIRSSHKTFDGKEQEGPRVYNGDLYSNVEGKGIRTNSSLKYLKPLKVSSNLRNRSKSKRKAFENKNSVTQFSLRNFLIGGQDLSDHQMILNNKSYNSLSVENQEKSVRFRSFDKERIKEEDEDEDGYYGRGGVEKNRDSLNNKNQFLVKNLANFLSRNNTPIHIESVLNVQQSRSGFNSSRKKLKNLEKSVELNNLINNKFTLDESNRMNKTDGFTKIGGINDRRYTVECEERKKKLGKMNKKFKSS